MYIYIYMDFFDKIKNYIGFVSKRFPRLQAACRGGELPITDSRPMCQKGYGAAARDRLSGAGFLFNQDRPKLGSS